MINEIAYNKIELNQIIHFRLKLNKIIKDDASVVSLEQILTSPSKSYSIKSEQQPNQELVSRIQILEKKIEHQR